MTVTPYVAQGPDPSTIISALNAAYGDPQTETRNQATEQLQQWSTEPGYHATLQEISGLSELPVETRLLAMTQLRIGVEKHWRRGAANTIHPDEKQVIKSRALSIATSLVDPRLQTQSAATIARIARTDFPDSWPTLLSDVTDLLQGFPGSALPILLQIVREFASVKPPKFTPDLHAIAPRIHDTLKAMYLASIHEWCPRVSADNPDRNSTQHLKAFMADDQQMASYMPTCCMALEAIRRLSAIGFQTPHKSPELQELWRTQWSQVELLLNLFLQKKLSSIQKASLKRMIIDSGKLFTEIANNHPSSFGFMPNTPLLVSHYWGSACAMRDQQASMGRLAEDDCEVFEAFNLTALILLRACFRIVYNPVHTFKGSSRPAIQEAADSKEVIKNEILTDAAVHEICKGIISKFLVALPADVERILNEPEEWELKEEGEDDAPNAFVRPCAERLLLDIALRNKGAVGGWLVEFSREVAGTGKSSGKDAVFAAVGCCASMVHDDFDINAFFHEIVLPELEGPNNEQPLVRRRVAILLSQWVTFLGVTERRITYDIFRRLLDPSVNLNTEVVQITAGTRLDAITRDMRFDAEAFMSQANAIVGHIMNLIDQVDNPETQVKLVSNIGDIIVRIPPSQTRQLSDQITVMLASLWQDFEETWMQQSIVRVLDRLVDSLGKYSNSTHPHVLPIIEISLASGTQLNLFILEDCLQLFKAVCKQCPSPAPLDLVRLAPYLLPTLEMPDHEQISLDILTILLVLNPEILRDECFRVQALMRLAPLLEKQAMTITLAVETLALMIRIFPKISEEFSNLMMRDLWNCGILGKVLDSIQGNWESRQSTGPRRKAPSNDWRNESDYFSMLARIILVDPASFVALVNSWALSRNLSFTDAMGNLLDQWLGGMEVANTPVQTKLSCMALTTLLESAQPWILGQLQQLMSLWTEVVSQLADDEENYSGDCLVFKVPPVSEEEAALSSDGGMTFGFGAHPMVDPHITNRQFDSLDDYRRHLLEYDDPVHKEAIQPFIRHYISITIEKVGSQKHFQETWLVNVDKDVLAEFQKRGIV